MSSAHDLDLAPVAPAGSLERVPVIDLRDDPAQVVDQVGKACRDWGFFQAVGHGVPAVAIAEVQAAARAFFARPRWEKRRRLRSQDNPWGYYDRELTKERRDRKEIFDIGPDAGGAGGADGEPFAGSTPWPAEVGNFEPVMKDWFGRMTRLSGQLAGLISAGLTGDFGALRAAFDPDHSSFLRLNFYPVEDPLAGEAGDEAGLGVHHHTDAGALTVLLQDDVAGLQVFHGGHWHHVEPVPGAFTINIGDMVQVWSNDAYQAPVHRALAMDRADRLSVPFFYNPSYAAEVAPLVGEPAYRPINWGEFRRRRADGDFADYGTEVQIGEWRLPA
ncbi:MAG TPA: 2OG-Fe(II) oxygenase family protein [Sphingomicrobium sp.]|nr:2OG-Fe(II) oxygenase family protein [Sphingomicrobium sp.]